MSWWQKVPTMKTSPWLMISSSWGGWPRSLKGVQYHLQVPRLLVVEHLQRLLPVALQAAPP